MWLVKYFYIWVHESIRFFTCNVFVLVISLVSSFMGSVWDPPPGTVTCPLFQGNKVGAIIGLTLFVSFLSGITILFPIIPVVSGERINLVTLWVLGIVLTTRFQWFFPPSQWFPYMYVDINTIPPKIQRDPFAELFKCPLSLSLLLSLHLCLL